MAKTLRPIRPNAGVRVMYGKDITRLLKAMSKDLEDVIFRAYSKQEHKFTAGCARRSSCSRLDERNFESYETLDATMGYCRSAYS